MPGDRWHCTGVDSDALNLTVSKPVMLHGVQHFGSEGGKYTVSLEVKNVRNGFSLVKQTRTYSSEKDETNIYYGFDVMFDHPVCLERGKKYEIISLIKGPPSWYVTDAGKNLTRFKKSSFHLAIQLLLIMELTTNLASFLYLFSAHCSFQNSLMMILLFYFVARLKWYLATFDL